MRDRPCLIIGSRPDGSLTWHPSDAKQPRGILPIELVPDGAHVGSMVRITAERDVSGNWHVLECTLPPTERNQSSLLVRSETPSTQTSAHTHLAFGQIRSTNIRNPIENSLNTGKNRPALVISGNDKHWRVMGFTTKSHYEDGQPRTPIPNYSAIGLNGPGYFWGRRLTRVDTIDIGFYIGEADRALLASLLNLARADLFMEEIAQLRKAMSDLAKSD